MFDVLHSNLSFSHSMGEIYTMFESSIILKVGNENHITFQHVMPTH